MRRNEKVWSGHDVWATESGVELRSKSLQKSQLSLLVSWRLCCGWSFSQSPNNKTILVWSYARDGRSPGREHLSEERAKGSSQAGHWGWGGLRCPMPVWEKPTLRLVEISALSPGPSHAFSLRNIRHSSRKVCGWLQVATQKPKLWRETKAAKEFITPDGVARPLTSPGAPPAGSGSASWGPRLV